MGFRSRTLKLSFYSRYGKRCFDAIAATAGLVVVSPLLILAAVAVRLESPGSAFFLQERSGQYGEPFRIIKFRTMLGVPAKNHPMITISGDSRITRIGRWLRKTKIDELPQLFNVLWGDMSLIGPRPEVPKYTTLYSPEQLHVFMAKPGMSGLASLIYVNEEELLSRQPDPERYYVSTLMPAKLKLDLAYCRNICLKQDLFLICSTLGRLLNLGQLSKARITEYSKSRENLS